jgi:tetratricopeptide (TPR) repeat protein
VKKPQIITACAGIALVALLYFTGKTEPAKKTKLKTLVPAGMNNAAPAFNTDSMLAAAKLKIGSEQVMRLNELENSISRGDVKDQQLKVYHQLAHFWGDTARAFEAYAWYEGQAARLENSEKSLTFAARLFLEGVRQENEPGRRKWKALQAKELYERSLSINPSNDSAQVELGMSYLYGGISQTPMEGIEKVRAVLSKDSTNIYALMALADASVFSGQYDKAIDRLKQVNAYEPANLDAILKLADAFTMIGKKAEAIKWYSKSLPLIKRPDWKLEVEKRIKELK